jgi:ABC-type transport system involved in multi-copper enzyme maturation permease subunit
VPRTLAQFGVLVAESFRDAVRRRIAGALVVLSLLSLALVESCTSCGTGTVVVNGAELDAARVFGWTGVLLYAVLALWTVALSGMLASDHLQQTLEDGTALLPLARPVGRASFALARLAGALVVSLGSGALLLAGTAAFLRARYALALGPAATAGVCAALGAAIVASLAMAASLYLPRLATVALVFAGVALVTAVNLAALFGVELSPTWAALDRFGPPLGTGIALAAAEWTGRALPASGAVTAARLALWAVLGPALLVVLFRRREV